MTASLVQIWRHPIKGIGAERLERIEVTANSPLPLDRAWAVLEEGGDERDGWRSCRNFLRGAKGPSLMAVTAEVLTVSEVLGPSDDVSDVTIPATRIRLSHFDRPAITIDPSRDGPALVDWVKPIYPESRQAPAKLVRAPAEGMADADFASVSLMSVASLRALSQKLGRDLDPRRFRGNLWVDGWAPWQEFELVGRHVAIGDAEFEVVAPITRCRAIEANPESGKRDTATLDTLEDGWGHTDFGVILRAVSGGTLRLGDPVQVP